MPRIAAHHLEGHPLRQDGEYTPSQAWPDDIYVQWGGNGIVLSEESYSTAFFEAFPKQGFIRGEGKTIADAEAQAFAQWQREHACSHETIGRRGYTNGAGTCLSCNAFMSGAFRPIQKLGAHRVPLSKMELSSIIKGWLRAAQHRKRADTNKHSHIQYLRARHSGIDLPPTPDTVMTSEQFMGFERDPYREACRDAVEAWILNGKCRLPQHEQAHLLLYIEESQKQDANHPA